MTKKQAEPGQSSGRETMSPRMQALATRLGRRMAEMRGALGLNQETVGARSGLSTSYVSMLERGTRLPHLEVLCTVAKVLGTTPEVLLGSEEMEEMEEMEAMHKVRAFLNTRALTGAEVDRLLGVARLMFPLRSGEPL